MVFRGGVQPSADRIQARPSFLPCCFQYPIDSCQHLWGGGNMRVFALAVLPAQSAQVTVLAKT